MPTLTLLGLLPAGRNNSGAVRPTSIAVGFIRAACLAALAVFNWSILVRLNAPITTKKRVSRIAQIIRNFRPDGDILGLINCIIAGYLVCLIRKL
jgi:hypothetical protein